MTLEMKGAGVDRTAGKGIGRRDFLKVAGATGLSLALLNLEFALPRGAAAKTDAPAAKIGPAAAMRNSCRRPSQADSGVARCSGNSQDRLILINIAALLRVTDHRAACRGDPQSR